MKQLDCHNPPALTKSELCNLYGISLQTLGKYMNNLFIKELQEVGYRKRMILLPPIVVRKFFDLYGKPLNQSDYENTV